MTLFTPQEGPRVFALPPGVDFIGALAEGLQARLASQPPEALADVEIFLNTRRAARALEARLAQGPARLLPRIRTITDLADDPGLGGLSLPAPVSALRRSLDLARLVRELLERTGIAPEAAAFGLAQTLGTLLDELAGEGIPVSALADHDVGTHAAHWQQMMRFVSIAGVYSDSAGPVTGEGRLRAAAEALAARWAAAPPTHPVILAGSTGSRAPTRVFMHLVARLPQGAVVLPGLDPDMPPAVWARLAADDPGATDHPQHAFRALGDALGFDPGRVPAWAPVGPASPARNALLALALRPAPVTDQWRAEAPLLVPHLSAATERLTWIEAGSPREEADAIALALREAAERQVPAALVTADRTLARRVKARLGQWHIIPDDSAGRPLALTPPGVFLTLIADLVPTRPSSQALLALLKHPLASSSPGARGVHLRHVQALETGPLAGHPPVVDWPTLAVWANERRPEAVAWVEWLRKTLHAPLEEEERPLAEHASRHMAAAEALAAGPDAAPGHALWGKAAGEAARTLLVEIEKTAEAADTYSLTEYRALFGTLMFGQDVPEEAVITHPGIAIWGTLEARSQHAFRVILGGLNEGTWPRIPDPDPWLSRPLRRALGLPAPETRIGLAAHDFTQAAGVPEVIFTRAIRDAEAPTVPSRWLLRLENLLKGMGEEGARALKSMQGRGDHWLDLAQALDKAPAPVLPAARPSPVPPPHARPRKLSVTRIETLIRDPYAIYAREVLRLKPLDPPGREADALARGTALHAVMEAFLAATTEALPPNAPDVLRDVAKEVLTDIPWPAVRAIWGARLSRIGGWLLATEAERRVRGTPFAREVRGELALSEPSFVLTAVADRIDRTSAGTYAIYDYKSGGVPSDKEARAFHLQLPLEAAIVQAGGFAAVPAAPATHLELIGLGKGESRLIDPDAVDETLARLSDLLALYLEQGTGFTARLRPQRISYESPYDHLARYGEWSDADEAVPEVVG